MLALLNEQGSQNIGKAAFKLCIQNAKDHNLFQKISTILDTTKLHNIKQKSTALPIILSLICVESKGNPKEYNSSYGATGLMQLTKDACDQIKANYGKMNDATENITAGILFINYIIKRFREKSTNPILQSKYLDADFPTRIAWIMLSYNNGFGGASKFANSDKKITDTLFYNDFKVYYDFWQKEENLKKIATAEEIKNLDAPKAKEPDKDKSKNKTPASDVKSNDVKKPKIGEPGYNGIFKYPLGDIRNLYEFNNSLVSEAFIKKVIQYKLLHS